MCGIAAGPGKIGALLPRSAEALPRCDFAAWPGKIGASLRRPRLRKCDVAAGHYMAFGSADAAHTFGLQGGQMVPPEFGRLLVSLWGGRAFQIPFWSCDLLAECRAVEHEKTLKALMSHGQAHACPLPPPLPPPLPGAGQAADGSAAAASGPDSPENTQHKL
jgi:hypothetical protein